MMVITYAHAHLNRSIDLCQAHAQTTSPLGQVQRGAHEGSCYVCDGSVDRQVWDAADLDNLTPGEAWDVYVGSDSTSSYTAEDLRRYVQEAPSLEGMSPDERLQVGRLLEACRARA